MTHGDDNLDPPRARRSGRRAMTRLSGAEAAWVTNRDRARAPRGGKRWCMRCDAWLGSPNVRCPRCGALEAAGLKRDPHA